MNQNTYSQLITFEPNQMIFSIGENDTDLFYIHAGKVMVFVSKSSQITPLAYLGAGEFLGELSFFDHQPRGAHVVAIETTQVEKFNGLVATELFPRWAHRLAKFMTGRIRIIDNFIGSKGIRRHLAGDVSPLSQAEQSRYFKILSDYLALKK